MAIIRTVMSYVYFRDVTRRRFIDRDEDSERKRFEKKQQEIKVAFDKVNE